MGKRFLKGVALGGLLGGLSVWMHTTPKGKQKKAELEAKLAELWKKIQKEYAAGHPNGLKDVKKDATAAFKAWSGSSTAGDVKKVLTKIAKKLK